MFDCQAERACWQRRAAGELAAILNANRDLPVIAWTVGTAGSALVGHIDGLGPAEQVRQAFDLWRAALMLTDHTETISGEATYLHAAARRNRVHTMLTATIIDDQDQAVEP